MLFHRGRSNREMDGTDRVFRKWFLEAEWVWETEQLVDELWKVRVELHSEQR